MQRKSDTKKDQKDHQKDDQKNDQKDYNKDYQKDDKKEKGDKMDDQNCQSWKCLTNCESEKHLGGEGLLGYFSIYWLFVLSC